MEGLKLPIDRLDTLRSIRVKVGLTQLEAAKQLGISEATLRSWEKDSSKIGYDDIQNIEKVYGVKHHFLFFGKESTFSELIRSNQHTA